MHTIAGKPFVNTNCCTSQTPVITSIANIMKYWYLSFLFLDYNDNNDKQAKNR